MLIFSYIYIHIGCHVRQQISNKLQEFTEESRFVGNDNIEIAILGNSVANSTVALRQVERKSAVSKESIRRILKNTEFYTVQHLKETDFQKCVNPAAALHAQFGQENFQEKWNINVYCALQNDTIIYSFAKKT